MSKKRNETEAWLDANDPTRKFKARSYRKRVEARRGQIGQDVDGLDPESVVLKHKAEEPVPDGRRLKAPPTGLQFLIKNRNHVGDACLLMPFAGKTVRSTVYHRGRASQASRVMCIIAHGEPPAPDHVARHLCGNGHLSCVNPAHLAWGTPEQNVRDDAAHKGLWSEPPIVRVAAAKEFGGGL
jgi:hypothetical protein